MESQSRCICIKSQSHKYLGQIRDLIAQKFGIFKLAVFMPGKTAVEK